MEGQVASVWRMSRLRWPKESDVVDVGVGDCVCEGCGERGRADYVRERKLRTWGGATKLRVQIRRCSNEACRCFGERVGAEIESAIAPPHWTVSWDLFSWMGHRRFRRPWSVPQIRAEMADRFSVETSEDWIEDYLRRYQVMVASRECDMDRMRQEYADVEDVILTI